MSDYKIIMMNTEKLKPYENNPRFNDKAVDAVAKSIENFGFKVPIVVDKHNVIVTGHTRLKAAQKLGLAQVPVIVADDLTPEKIKAFRLADNKVSELADWDFSKLEAELAGLEMDMTQFNFDMKELSKEFDKNKEVIEDDFDVDAELNNGEEPTVKRGQVWKLGNHYLMCGDSTSKEDVIRLMNGKKADLVFTDPPYGYEYQSNLRVKSKKFDVLKNDDKILDFVPAIKDVIKGFVFVCTTWKVLDKWLPLFKNYFKLSNMIIWNKGGGGIGDLRHTFATDYEIILCSNNGNEITGKRIGSVWNVAKDSANEYVHATQKPVGLAAMAIENTTIEGDTVLDVFGGSGSTLIACEQLKRKCYTMELDPKYCDVIIKRWETLTGKQAVKL